MPHGERGERPASPCRARPGCTRWRAGGFAYLWLLFFIACMGASLAAAGVVWEVRTRREKEADLLFVGAEFRRAITEYYRLSPQAARQLPTRLEDLLEDRRSGAMRRHLRRIYPDPLTGKPEWGLIAQGGRISGVYSRADGVPVRRAGFAKGDEAFAGASSYAQWRFIATDLQASPAGATLPAPGTAPSAGLSPAAQTAPSASGAPPAAGDANPRAPVQNAAAGAEKPPTTPSPAAEPGSSLSGESIRSPGNLRNPL